MHVSFLHIPVVVATMALAIPLFGAGKKFGSEIVLKETVSLKYALASFDSYKDKDILIAGTIEKVCQKKGCWLTFKTDADEIRVTFKDYKFFIPLDAAGQPVRLQGRLEKKQVSVKDQKHFLEDEGAPAEKIEAIKSPKVEYSFVAAGVEIG